MLLGNFMDFLGGNNLVTEFLVLIRALRMRFWECFTIKWGVRDYLTFVTFIACVKKRVFGTFKAPRAETQFFKRHIGLLALFTRSHFYFYKTDFLWRRYPALRTDSGSVTVCVAYMDNALVADLDWGWLVTSLAAGQLDILAYLQAHYALDWLWLLNHI